MILEKVTKELNKLDNWALEGISITKQFEFGTFKDAIDFVNNIAIISEKIEHHPDIQIRYNIVFLMITTHSAKSLTEKDFILAAEIDKLQI